MVDWKKPLQIVGFGQAPLPCRPLTTSLKGDKLVVETGDGMVYAAYKSTGLLQGELGFARVTNAVEPWEKAWLSNKYAHESFFDPKEYFKLVFNLGRASVEGR